MAVVCRQWNGLNEYDGAVTINKVEEAELDAATLERKRVSHAAKGWVVTPVLGGFDAAKVRWEGVTCLREFRIV